MSAVAPSFQKTASDSRALSQDDARASVVVVGNGPVGFRLLHDLVKRQLHQTLRITVFGEEPRPAYDRVNLTRVLDSGSGDDLCFQPTSWYESHGIILHTGDPVVRIDRANRFVTSRSDRVIHYDRLILATGSRPFVPPISGADHEGVFVYRTIEDLFGIRTWIHRRSNGGTGPVAASKTGAHGKHAVVLGGGLLGLEAARALQKLGCQVTVVEMASVLMPRQLDNAAAALLLRQIKAAGLRVLLQHETRAVEKHGQNLLVRFSDHTAVEADLVVLSAGIRPRDELARNCNLQVGRRGGIVVDAELRTSDESIFAIGECAEHEGVVYGLAAPGYQMANVVADRLRGTDAAFSGCLQPTRLKLVGINVIFAGDYIDPSGAMTPVWQSPDSYLKLIVRDGRLVGLVGVGEIAQTERLQEAVTQRRRVFWFQIRRFESEGRLWKDRAGGGVSEWPTTTVVCSCRSVSVGTLLAACASGCETSGQLSKATEAGTVCGSCIPLLEQLATGKRESPVFRFADILTAAVSIVGLVLVALLISGQPAPPHVSVQTSATIWQTLVHDVFWKQVTGYFIGTAAICSLLISLRRRTNLLRRFEFSTLRALHVILATLAVAMLMVHTGFHRGHNLNFILFSTFVAAVMSGALVGIVTGLELKLPTPLRSIRKPLTWLHILVLWPLPLLICFHIVSVYWF